MESMFNWELENGCGTCQLSRGQFRVVSRPSEAEPETAQTLTRNGETDNGDAEVGDVIRITDTGELALAFRQIGATYIECHKESGGTEVLQYDQYTVVARESEPRNTMGDVEVGDLIRLRSNGQTATVDSVSDGYEGAVIRATTTGDARVWSLRYGEFTLIERGSISSAIGDVRTAIEDFRDTTVSAVSSGLSTMVEAWESVGISFDHVRHRPAITDTETTTTNSDGVGFSVSGYGTPPDFTSLVERLQAEHDERNKPKIDAHGITKGQPITYQNQSGTVLDVGLSDDGITLFTVDVNNELLILKYDQFRAKQKKKKRSLLIE